MQNNKVVITLPTIPLTLIFIILKVTETIDWSWLWVLSPLWLPFVLFFGGVAFLFVIAILLCLGIAILDNK
jgi:hypothetical protein